MLDFLGRVPPPQVRGRRVGAGEMLGIGQQFMRQNGGEMFERHGRCKTDDRRPRLGYRKPPLHLGFKPGQVIARIGGPAVERQMLAAVDDFLGGETANVFGQARLRAVTKGAHALDEKRLAQRKGRRQGIVERGRERIAAMPPARGRLAPAEPPVAGSDGQVAGSDGRIARANGQVAGGDGRLDGGNGCNRHR